MLASGLLYTLHYLHSSLSCCLLSCTSLLVKNLVCQFIFFLVLMFRISGMSILYYAKHFSSLSFSEQVHNTDNIYIKPGFFDRKNFILVFTFFFKELLVHMLWLFRLRVRGKGFALLLQLLVVLLI